MNGPDVRSPRVLAATQQMEHARREYADHRDRLDRAIAALSQARLPADIGAAKAEALDAIHAMAIAKHFEAMGRIAANFAINTQGGSVVAPPVTAFPVAVAVPDATTAPPLGEDTLCRPCGVVGGHGSICPKAGLS